MKNTLLILAAFSGLSIQAAPPVVLSRGHTDAGIALDRGAFDIHVHDEMLDREFAPASAVLRVLASAERTVPSAPAYSFLGTPGAPAWILPADQAEAEADGLLFLGIGTEELSPTDFVGDLQLALTGVTFTPEPGGAPTANFSLFTTDATGTPTIHFSTHDGVNAADTISLIPGSHTHVNWGFTQPGRYAVTVKVTGTLSKAGNPVISASDTYSFVVKSHQSPAQNNFTVGDLLELPAGGVRITRLTAPIISEQGGGAVVASIAGSGVTSANDNVLIRTDDAALVAREGDAPIAGTALATFGNVQAHGGSTVFTADLKNGVGGVNASNNTVLLAAGNFPGVVAREGDAVLELSGYFWTTFTVFHAGENGVVNLIGNVRDPVLKKTRTVLYRAVPGGSGYTGTVLAATGATITTDSGVHTIRTISRPTRPGQRFADADGSASLWITMTDGSSEIIRFAPPVQPLE